MSKGRNATGLSFYQQREIRLLNHSDNHLHLRQTKKEKHRMPVRIIAQRTLLSLVVAAPLTLHAAPRSLDALVVVGSRAPALISQVLGTVWVLEGEELEQQLHS